MEPMAWRGSDHVTQPTYHSCLDHDKVLKFSGLRTVSVSSSAGLGFSRWGTAELTWFYATVSRAWAGNRQEV